MTAPVPPAHDHSHEEPVEENPTHEAAVVALAALLAAAAAAALFAALAGAAGVAGTAAQTVGAVVAGGRRGVFEVAPQRRDYAAEAVDTLVGMGIPRSAAEAVVRAFWRMPLPAARRPGSVGEQQRLEAARWRARYLVAAARRLAAAIARAQARARAEQASAAERAAAAARAAREQLERERRYAQQHREAEQARMDNADRLDRAEAEHGPTLVWWAELDERTTWECRVAHGHTFTIAAPPRIGLPGTGPHARCRCAPVAPRFVLCPQMLDVNAALARPTAHRHGEG